MNRILLVSACLLVVGAPAILSAQEIKLPGQQEGGAAAPASAPAPKFTDQQVLEALGWYVGRRIGLAEFDLTKEELEIVMKGMRSAIAGKESPYNEEQIGSQVNAFVEKKQGQFLGKLRKESLAENAAFFAKLKENKNVVELPSGLRYEIIQPGSGAFPKPNDVVKVHYTGKLLDGDEFDSSVKRGQPSEIPLDGGMIPGFAEGVQKINQGGKIRLYIPPELGYGDAGTGPIPPAAALIFDVELLEVKPGKPAQAPAPAREPKK